MGNIYKIDSGEITEKELDLIIISLSHLLATSYKEKSFGRYTESTELLLDKIMRNGA